MWWKKEAAMVAQLHIACEGVRGWLTSLMQRDEPPQKISKLSIAAETEEDRYETSTKVICYQCKLDQVDSSSGKVWFSLTGTISKAHWQLKLSTVVAGVLQAATFARREEVKAWEQELTPCDHTVFLQQESSRNIDSQGLSQMVFPRRAQSLKLSSYRPWSLLNVRSQGESMALPPMWQPGMWPCSSWWCYWELSCPCSCKLYASSCYG